MAVNQSLTLTQVSQSITDNTSQVRLLWQSTQTGASYNGYTRTATYWVRVNAGAWTAYTVQYTLPQNQTVTVADVTLTVEHDSAGACLVEAATSMDTGISAGTVELQKSLRLDTIARYSQITATDANIGGICTVRVQKQNSAYKHCVRYSLTGDTPWTYIDENGQESTREVIFSRETVAFRVPEHFYNRIPAAKSGTCTLECWTYIADTVYLPEGRKTTFTYTADPQKCAPGVSCTLEDTNGKTLALTGNSTTLVRYMSDAEMAVTAVGNCGATVTDPAQNVSVWYKDTWYYGTELSFPGVETDYFKLWARDSRGYTVYQNYYAPEFISYVRVTNQSNAQRLTPTGSTLKLTISGSFYNGSFGGTNNIKNLVQVWYRIADSQAELASARWVELTPALSGNSYSAQVTLDGVLYDRTYWVETWVNDKLETVTQTVKIGRGLPVFDWGEQDFCFHVPVEVPALTVNGVELAAYIKSVIQGG